MPFALVIIGLVMVVTGAKGTQSALAKQLQADFTGEGNFLYWFMAIGSLGALGSIPEFRTFSRTFMALVLIAMVIRNGGIFDKFIQAVEKGPISPEANPQFATAGKSDGALKYALSSNESIQAMIVGVSKTADQSISASNAQQSNAGRNFGLLARVFAPFL